MDTNHKWHWNIFSVCLSNYIIQTEDLFLPCEASALFLQVWDCPSPEVHCCINVEWPNNTMFASCSANMNIHIMNIKETKPIKTLMYISMYKFPAYLLQFHLQEPPKWDKSNQMQSVMNMTSILWWWSHCTNMEHSWSLLQSFPQSNTRFVWVRLCHHFGWPQTGCQQCGMVSPHNTWNQYHSHIRITFTVLTAIYLNWHQFVGHHLIAQCGCGISPWVIAWKWWRTIINICMLWHLVLTAVGLVQEAVMDGCTYTALR